MNNDEKANAKRGAWSGGNSTDPEDEARVLSPKAQEELGRLLRASYDKVAAEPLPDKFIKLLEQLSKPDKSERRE